MDLTWTVANTDELSAQMLLSILRVRAEVFVVEQQCIYADPDEYDVEAIHLFAHHEEKLVAYARILAPLTRFSEASIGRVLTVQSVRGKTLGKELMQRAMQECVSRFGSSTIRLSAQRYLERFYEELGFEIDSDPYLEDGIPHIEVIWHQS